jgi:hypothetical protein
MNDGDEASFSSRRVATVVAVLGAILFVAGLVIDLTRHTIYRHFYMINDASAVALFCVAAAYLHWGDSIAARRCGRVGGRIAQAYAVLAVLGQAEVWVHVARRGNVWWALIFLIPTILAAAMAIVAVHLALRRTPVEERDDRRESEGCEENEDRADPEENEDRADPEDRAGRAGA